MELIALYLALLILYIGGFVILCLFLGGSQQAIDHQRREYVSLVMFILLTIPALLGYLIGRGV